MQEIKKITMEEKKRREKNEEEGKGVREERRCGTKKTPRKKIAEDGHEKEEK
jgi:hypothetical protein